MMYRYSYLKEHMSILKNTHTQPQCEKKYFLISARNEDPNQPAHPRGIDSNQNAHPRTLMRVFVVLINGTLHHWLSKMRRVKILIRLCKCAG